VTTVRADTRLNRVLEAVEVLKDDAKRVRVASVNMVVRCWNQMCFATMSSVHLITEPRFVNELTAMLPSLVLN